jgi:hypothetical protein
MIPLYLEKVKAIAIRKKDIEARILRIKEKLRKTSF